jgi:hypothetical protein
VACFAWKQVALRFSSLALKLAEIRLRVVHVASSRRLRREKTEDGWIDVTSCVGPFNPKIIIFIVLGSKDVVFFKSFA